MGWIRIGTPSRAQSEAGLTLVIIIIVVAIVAIVYNHSTFHLVRVIHSEPASKSNSAAFEYLKRKPKGRYSGDACDTLIKYCSTLPSYTVFFKNAGYFPANINNNLQKMCVTKNQVPGSPAEKALDSLIRSRLNEEYGKALTLNTDEAWELFDCVVPEEYKNDYPRVLDDGGR